MKQKIVVMLAAVCFFVGLYTVPAAAFTNIDFYHDATIQAGDIYGNVGVYDTPPNHTTLTMIGGNVDSLATFDESTANISGGKISTLSAYYYSTINITGGEVNGLRAYGNSIAFFSENAVAGTLGTRDSGIVNMTGGTTDIIWGGDNGCVNMYGGIITEFLSASSESSINIYGYGVSIYTTGGIVDQGQVTGFWFDGNEFSIDLYGYDTHSRINVVPEPCSILLIAFGAFFLNRKRSQ